MFAILTKEIAPLADDLPQSLQRIVTKALAKQPENRYQTCGEMRDEPQKSYSASHIRKIIFFVKSRPANCLLFCRFPKPFDR